VLYHVGAGTELINRIFTLGIELHFISWGTYVRNTSMDYARYNMAILFSGVERRTIVNRLHEGSATCLISAQPSLMSGVHLVQELLADPEAKLRGMQNAQKVAIEKSSDLLEKIAACVTTIAGEERELDHLYADRKQYRDNP
jgi:hypothetical protein